MATVSVRYIVDDVDAAGDFYCNALGFREEMRPAPTFAMLSRGDLRLALSAPSGAGGGGQSMPDGRRPEPGGWNRFMLEVDDLERVVGELRKTGARFRNDIVTGVGGKQILVEDPSGNPIELFEPTLPEAALEADPKAASSTSTRAHGQRARALGRRRGRKQALGRVAAWRSRACGAARVGAWARAGRAQHLDRVSNLRRNPARDECAHGAQRRRPARRPQARLPRVLPVRWRSCTWWSSRR